MRIFIGNATSQNFDFHYRLPETRGFRSQFIEMGRQVTISGDLSQKDIDEIVEQGSIYGMISVDEVDRRATKYHGLVYSVDKPISSSKIEKLFHANTAVLVHLGQQLRRDAAIVENNRLLKNNQEMDLPSIRNTEMSIQEEKDNGNGQMAEGYRAEFDVGTTKPRGRRRTRS
jgi:hypothetical protein